MRVLVGLNVGVAVIELERLPVVVADAVLLPERVRLIDVEGVRVALLLGVLVRLDVKVAEEVIELERLPVFVLLGVTNEVLVGLPERVRLIDVEGVRVALLLGVLVRLDVKVAEEVIELERVGVFVLLGVTNEVPVRLPERVGVFVLLGVTDEVPVRLPERVGVLVRLDVIELERLRDGVRDFVLDLVLVLVRVFVICNRRAAGVIDVDTDDFEAVIVSDCVVVMRLRDSDDEMLFNDVFVRACPLSRIPLRVGHIITTSNEQIKDSINMAGGGSLYYCC